MVVSFEVTESCLIHLRNMDDFLGGQPLGRVTAADYVPGWTPERFLTAEERAAIDSSLSALTPERHAADPDWPLLRMAASRASTPSTTSCDTLDPEAATWFGDEIAKAEALLAAST